MIAVKYKKDKCSKRYYEKIKDFSLRFTGKGKRKSFNDNLKEGDETSITLEKAFNRCKEKKLYNFHTLFKESTFNDLITSSFEELLNYKFTKPSKEDELFAIKTIFGYDAQQPKISKYFEKNVELHTCYYCNIDYVNVVLDKDSNSEFNLFTLDHVIDKGDYPWLALSFYNLVPSCYGCNSKIKGTESIGDVSPTSDSFDFDDQIGFNFIQQNDTVHTLDALINNKENLDLKLLNRETSYNKTYDKYIRNMKLEERYSFHKDKATDILKKKEQYPKSKVKEMANFFGVDFDELEKDIFGAEVQARTEVLHELPFTKLKRDIYNLHKK